MGRRPAAVPHPGRWQGRDPTLVRKLGAAPERQQVTRVGSPQDGAEESCQQEPPASPQAQCPAGGPHTWGQLERHGDPVVNGGALGPGQFGVERVQHAELHVLQEAVALILQDDGHSDLAVLLQASLDVVCLRGKVGVSLCPPGPLPSLHEGPEEGQPHLLGKRRSPPRSKTPQIPKQETGSGTAAVQAALPHPLPASAHHAGPRAHPPKVPRAPPPLERLPGRRL